MFTNLQEEWDKHLEKLLSDLLDENGVIQVMRVEGAVTGRSEAGVAQVRARGGVCVTRLWGADGPARSCKGG